MRTDGRGDGRFPALVGFEKAKTVTGLSEAIREAAGEPTEISSLGGCYNVEASRRGTKPVWSS
ncbi:hypothetical protein [Methylobacterium radiotolerans]|uniref:hypothetical protein n=1 Tax=Methylobacterium radiotolerans TaxID=31998 RepID=UPI0015F46740|nr:hypothetical protein [Methylobacterium radiotolerans]